MKTTSLFKTLGLTALLALGVAGSAVAQDAAKPAEATSAAPAKELPDEPEMPVRQSWTFAGPFGKFDEAQLQRGFMVYKTVCANCHSMKYLSFSELASPGGPGFTEGQVKALAATYQVGDINTETGDAIQRPGLPSDHFPWNFPNEQAARAALHGALPPDMSRLEKARGYSRGFPQFVLDMLPYPMYQEHGADYIYGVLTHYDKTPDGIEIPDGQYYNPNVPGRKFAMPPPLSDGLVPYTDGSPQTVDQYARDVTAFLAWTADPHLTERHEMGLKVIVFLLIFAVLMYYTKKKVWSDVEH